MPRQVYNPAREELVHIAGDAPDPMGSGLMGKHSSLRLTKTAAGHPLIRYKDRVLEADVYLSEPTLANPASIMVHLICPRCLNALRISNDKKAMEYDAATDTLSVERMRCTWELGAERREFGIGMCNWTVAIDHNIAKDA